MKQNGIFFYVKRNNNSSEGVNSYQQCSSNVKEAPKPKRTKCNSIAKARKWDHTYLRYGSFLRNSECSRYVPEMQEQDQSIESLNFLLFTFCNNCLSVEVSNNEIFDFLTSKSCEGSMTNAKVHQGFHDDKKVEEHCSGATFNRLWSRLSHMFVINYLQICFRFCVMCKT